MGAGHSPEARWLLEPGDEKETCPLQAGHPPRRARAASILPTARGKSPVLREDAINSVIFSVFCLFPWNGLMDVNNYQTIKASKCATFYRSKSSNK